IMIAGVRKIESEKHVEIIDLDRTNAQMKRRELQQQRVQLQSFVKIGRIHVTTGQSLLFEAQPSVRKRTALFFEVVVAAVACAEAGHHWEVFLNALEEVEKRLTTVRQIQLRPKPHVDVEILAERRVRICHTSLEALSPQI